MLDLDTRHYGRAKEPEDRVGVAQGDLCSAEGVLEHSLRYSSCFAWMVEVIPGERCTPEYG